MFPFYFHLVKGLSLLHVQLRGTHSLMKSVTFKLLLLLQMLSKPISLAPLISDLCMSLCLLWFILRGKFIYLYIVACCVTGNVCSRMYAYVHGLVCVCGGGGGGRGGPRARARVCVCACVRACVRACLLISDNVRSFLLPCEDYEVYRLQHRDVIWESSWTYFHSVYCSAVRVYATLPFTAVNALPKQSSYV